MKKSGIFVLIAITLIFAAFIAGFYIGRNANHVSVQVSSLPPKTQPASSAAATIPGIPTISTAPSKVNINLATLEELQTLPGIGPALANNIIQYRMTYGYFHSVNELTKVPNFGQKRLEALLDYITV